MLICKYPAGRAGNAVAVPAVAEVAVVAAVKTVMSGCVTVPVKVGEAMGASNANAAAKPFTSAMAGCVAVKTPVAAS